ncbi:MAG: hypothetical protein HY332_06965, partial [Chloroflexi bacterium]|nr:hypothetical protein [Chloroflexota bacterium]
MTGLEAVATAPPGTCEEAVAAVRQWTRRVWAGEAAPAVGAPGREGWWAPDLPFSFVYGGAPSAELLSRCVRRREIEEGEGRTVWRVVLTDPLTGLEVVWEATTYGDLPAVEWLVHCHNPGAAPSPILERVRALDLVLATDPRELVVYHATGGIAHRSGQVFCSTRVLHKYGSKDGSGIRPPPSARVARRYGRGAA